ncbi:MAG TPA: hypothetical protein VL475_12835, partial [Planctomycetaceae bacterium]|nr:hypothetical protein [Planctomycetaceae bacterium]
RHDGVSWAVLFNLRTDAERHPLDEIIAPMLEKAADAIVEWPEGNVPDRDAHVEDDGANRHLQFAAKPRQRQQNAKDPRATIPAAVERTQTGRN